MNSRTIFALFVLILAVSASAGCIFYDPSNNVEVTIKTNGSYVEVYISPFLFSTIPETMKQEMANRAWMDVQNDTSTVESLKNDINEIAQSYNYTATVKIDSQFGTDQLPMAATVKGESMLPTLQDGQAVVLVKTKDFKVGDIVVARHPTKGLIIKRVAEIKGDQVYLKGDNREVTVSGNMIYRSLDTWLPIHEVVGVVKEY